MPHFMNHTQYYVIAYHYLQFLSLLVVISYELISLKAARIEFLRLSEKNCMSPLIMTLDLLSLIFEHIILTITHMVNWT